MTSRSTRVLAAAGASVLAFSVAGPGHAGAGSEGGWTVDTEDCSDPDRANAPIEGTISIGSAMPLSGGAAAAAFEPAARGLQAYIDYANENDLVPGYELALTVGDDQFDPALTPGVVNGLIDDGVHLFAGMIGTQNNLAVRDTLNEECIPQLNVLAGDPRFGEVADYPWTTGLLTSYEYEFGGYAQSIVENFPDSTVGVFYVNNEFGNISIDNFRAAADEAGLEIVDEQTVELGDEAPPQSQLSSLAESAPDIIVAVPLGAQCISFLNELANAKAASDGWEPVVYMTNTCAASPLILAGAGENANGIYSSAAMGIADVANPEVAAVEPVASYIAYMDEKGLGDIITTGAAGWNAGEVAVAVLAEAAQSPEGLTQASIINAARNLNFHPSLVREGMEYIMNGEEDAFYSQDIQIVQYDAAAGFFTDIGEPYSFEASAGE
jgi:ABC-type branched-subunit amino acid transport system substrate-binding protein